MMPRVETSSPDDDCTKLTVDFDIEEDIEAELSEFVRLSCTGHCEEAEDLFQECLSPYQNLFPVAAEYGDFLSRQERFQELVSFTAETSTSKFPEPKEAAIFELMKIIAELHLSESSTARKRRWLALAQQTKKLWVGVSEHSVRSLDLHACLRHVVGASCPNAYPDSEILTLKSATD